MPGGPTYLLRDSSNWTEPSAHLYREPDLARAAVGQGVGASIPKPTFDYPPLARMIEATEDVVLVGPRQRRAPALAVLDRGSPDVA